VAWRGQSKLNQENKKSCDHHRTSYQPPTTYKLVSLSVRQQWITFYLNKIQIIPSGIQKYNLRALKVTTHQ
jgi:hypothetical protein